MANRNVSIEDIRTFLRDRLERNDLHERFEFTDHEIEKAMQMALDEFNLFTPLSSYQQIPNRALSILGTASVLLNSEAFAQIRNQLTYSDGGTHVGVDDKAQLYAQLASGLSAKFEQKASDLKMQINAENAFGGVSSPLDGLPVL